MTDVKTQCWGLGKWSWLSLQSICNAQGGPELGCVPPSSTPVKSEAWWHGLVGEDGERKSPGAPWPISLAEWMGSRDSERP